MMHEASGQIRFIPRWQVADHTNFNSCQYLSLISYLQVIISSFARAAAHNSGIIVEMDHDGDGLARNMM